MTVSYSFFPKNWRTSMDSQIQQQKMPELAEAFCLAKAVLEDWPDAEIQQLGNSLLQLIAKLGSEENQPGPSAAIEYLRAPRNIYAVYSKGLQISSPQKTLKDGLAFGTLAALYRVCKAVDQVTENHNWIAAANAVAEARVFGEWLYLVDAKSNGVPVFFTSMEHKSVRTLAKKKLTQAKSAAAKKGARKVSKPLKMKMIAYYEKNKHKYKSAAHAAFEISLANVVIDMEYSTIYKWLRDYLKAAKSN